MPSLVLAGIGMTYLSLDLPNSAHILKMGLFMLTSNTMMHITTPNPTNEGKVTKKNLSFDWFRSTEMSTNFLSSNRPESTCKTLLYKVWLNAFGITET